MDSHIIRIDNAPAFARVGVTAEERAQAQKLIVSVELALVSPPDFPAQDHIRETVDYDRILRFLREGLIDEMRLIETVADTIARHCLELSLRVTSAEVKVEKPSVLNGAGHVSVSIRRTR
jgi:dihydroneopterin aldolase